MTVVAVPLWVDQAILIGVPVIWAIVFVAAVGLCRAAALGDRQTISTPHGTDAAPHPGPGAGTPSSVSGPRGRRQP